MKALGLGLLLAITTLSSAQAHRSPETLPIVTVDCYQSFAAKAALSELTSKERRNRRRQSRHAVDSLLISEL